VLLSALIFHYKNKKKLSKKNQLHEWITQPLLPVKTITRIKGQTCVQLLPKKLLGSFSLIQREVGIFLLTGELPLKYVVAASKGSLVRSGAATSLCSGVYSVPKSKRCITYYRYVVHERPNLRAGGVPRLGRTRPLHLVVGTPIMGVPCIMKGPTHLRTLVRTANSFKS
jgi:hypothetical protein